jgi:Ca2+-binding EF-hand superfamily protein
VSDKEFHYRDFLAVDGSRPPSRLSDDLREFALDLQKRGIELSEALALSDTQHTGRVSSGAFRRLLGDSALNSRIMRQFEHPVTHEIDYVQLSRDVWKFVRGSPEPAAVVDTSTFLGQVAASLRDQRIDIRSRLRDLDRRKRNHLTRYDFICELSSCHITISPRQLEQLADAYADTNGNADYRPLADDIDAVTRPPRSNSGEKPDIARTLVYLKESMRSRHSQLEAAVRALDLFGLGVVSAVHFVQCLDRHKLDLGPGDVDALKEEFGDADGNIEIERFLRAVLPAAQERQQPSVEVVDVLIKLDAVEKRNTVEYSTEFRRHDSFLKGEIAVSHFKSVLLAHVLGLTPAEVDTLVAFYQVSPQRVNDGNLLQDKLRFALEPSSAPTDTAAQIIDRLREILTQCNIHADEVFARQDSQESGKVFALRVRPILDSIGFKLSEHDEKVLREEFAVEGAPDMFDYQRLCALIAQSDIFQRPEPQDRENVALANSLRERIQARKERVRDAFPEGTPKALPERDFRNPLQSLGLAIREVKLQRILKYCRTGRKKEVDWQQVVLDVETSRATQS